MRAITRHTGRLCYRVSKNRARRFTTTAAPRSNTNERPSAEETSIRGVNSQRETAEDATEENDGRRRGFRRTLRNRLQAPPPPPLPAWFLKTNVVLSAEKSFEGEQDQRSIDCVDTATGHVLFSIPYSKQAAACFGLEEAPGVEQDKTTDDAAVPGDAESAVKPVTQSQGFSDDVLPAMGTTGNARQDGSDQRLLSSSAANMVQIEGLVRAIFSTSGSSLSTFAASRSDLSLLCSDPTSHDAMDTLITDLAATVNADVVRIDANDIADLTDDYVGQGNDLPGTFASLAHDAFDGHSSTKIGTPIAIDISHMLRRGESDENDRESEEQDEDEDEEDEDAEDKESDDSSPRIQSIMDLFKSRAQNLGAALNRVPPGTAISFGIPAGIISGNSMRERKSSKSDSDFVQWDDARLGTILEQIVDAPSVKRQDSAEIMNHESSETLLGSKEDTFAALAKIISRNQKSGESLTKFHFTTGNNRSARKSNAESRTIIHLRDLQNISRSKLGETIVRRLAKVAQKQRRLGKEMVIVATSSGALPVMSSEDSPFIKLLIAKPGATNDLSNSIEPLNPDIDNHLQERGYSRILDINTRHINSMLRKVQSDLTAEDLFSMSRDQMLSPGIGMLTERTLSQRETHRLVLLAAGLKQIYACSDKIEPIHISLAAAVLTRAKEHVRQSRSFIFDLQKQSSERSGSKDSESKAGKERLDKIKAKCNSHESRLLTGVVDAQNIKTGFKDVHVAPETIEALKTMTTLSLLRPDAFKYGVLAVDNLSGLMLYGPPGTGKTLLAKAVAKESKATVLEVSGAQIYEKYVGEGEKMVRAVFTLAKKLSPCVVFIDEADALFGTRSTSGNRSTHREILNQFLREWDGMDDHRVFLMIASNRPFDLDDAVLRRLPRRLLVDLPTPDDRRGILGIHLRGEQLDSAVSLQKLAEQTPFYSGSDLKNVCVAAALAAVREENDLAQQHEDDAEFKLPEKRTLSTKHFEKALQEISASISEDMSSLNAIRKFDEKYGDRRGRRKKATYGFGANDGAADESAARVRQGP